MIRNHTYTHIDGVIYHVLAYYDEESCRCTPDGYESDHPYPRYVGINQYIDTGRYVSAKTGSTVYVIMFEAAYEIDSTMGYTIMTTDPRCAEYTDDQQDTLVKAIHAFVTGR